MGESDLSPAASSPLGLLIRQKAQRRGTPSALDDPLNPKFPEPLIDPSEIVSGGPAPDGIPPIDGLQFDPHDHGFVDRQSGSIWNVLGQATVDPLLGEQPTPHVHLDTFWFAWDDFHPNSGVVTPGA